MQTYSHLILTAALNRHLKKRVAYSDQVPPLDQAATLLGSVAPDLPLILIAGGFLLSDRIRGRRVKPSCVTVGESNIGRLFTHHFFHNPLIKLAHNLFHAPLMVMVYLSIGYLGWKRGKKWGAPLFWFALSCALHTGIDIPIHHNDGPLIFFPFDWETRFRSPLSYWDPAHHGKGFAQFEHGVDLFLLLHLINNLQFGIKKSDTDDTDNADFRG